jgi:hypothetical protein
MKGGRETPECDLPDLGFCGAKRFMHDIVSSQPELPHLNAVIPNRDRFAGAHVAGFGLLKGDRYD